MKKELFTPGRTELAGNHTDHQKGRVLASAVDLGLYAKYEANDEGVVRIRSLGYEPFEVKINQLAVRPAEFGSPKSLVRGMITEFAALGICLLTNVFDWITLHPDRQVGVLPASVWTLPTSCPTCF